MAASRGPDGRFIALAAATPVFTIPSFMLTVEQYEAGLASGAIASSSEPEVIIDHAALDSVMGERGIGDFLCKVWRAVLKLFNAVVDGVLNVLTTVGKAIITLLSELLDTVGSAIGDLFADHPILTLLLGGLALWWLVGLLGKRKDDDVESNMTPLDRTPPPLDTPRY
jgi:hypothetical protein